MIASLRLLKLGFLVWAAVELAQGHVGYALALVVTFAVVQLPRLLRLPWVFDVAFVVAWTLQSLGQVAGFFSRFSWWHVLVHVSLPAVLAPTAVIVLMRLRLLPDVLEDGDLHQGFAIGLLVFLIATTFGSLYEIYEWISDVNFGTRYDPTKAHALTDISANAAGGLLGGLWLAAWAGRRMRGGSAQAHAAKRSQPGSHLITSRAHRGRHGGRRPNRTS
jgi:hypothetical protein